MAQFLFFPVTSKLEKSKAVAPSAQLCPLGYGRGGAAWLLLPVSMVSRRREEKERGLGMVTADSTSFGTLNAPVQLNNQLGIKKLSP